MPNVLTPLVFGFWSSAKIFLNDLITELSKSTYIQLRWLIGKRRCAILGGTFKSLTHISPKFINRTTEMIQTIVPTSFLEDVFGLEMPHSRKKRFSFLFQHLKEWRWVATKPHCARRDLRWTPDTETEFTPKMKNRLKHLFQHKLFIYQIRRPKWARIRFKPG